MLKRLIIVCLCLLGGAALLARSSKTEEVPIRRSFAEFPFSIDGWQGRREADFEQKILDVLGVDDYLTATYFKQGALPTHVYVGYYGSQRQGDTMHSPLNCLPGAGWLPVAQDRTTIQVTGPDGPREIEVNDFVIEKGLDRQVVVYWYQSHGRVVASEYWGKVFTVVDAMRYNRTDGALVRIVVPVPGADDAALERARAQAREFVKTMFPVLSNYLPS
jgi:EpsI family protein